MNYASQDLLSIGSFANAAQLSIKALRLYAQLGILTPSYIDPESGYRYYHTDQLRAARLIRMMRQIDMPLATIRQVLMAAPGDAELLVRDYYQALEVRVMQARKTMHDLVSVLRQETLLLPLDVGVRKVAPQPIVSITKHVTVDQLSIHIQESLTALSALVEAQGGVVVGAPFGRYHGAVSYEDNGPLEVCLPVQHILSAGGQAVACELAGGHVAYVVLQGDQCAFPAILTGYDLVYDWIHQNGYELADSPREIWYSMPGAVEHLEIAWLFREPRAA